MNELLETVIKETDNFGEEEDEQSSAITTFIGQLEIDHNRGVIYFHSSKGITLLRICRLLKPIPKISEEQPMLDITIGYGVNWKLK